MGHTSPDHAVDIDQSERERERERGREGGREGWISGWVNGEESVYREQNKQTQKKENCMLTADVSSIYTE